MLIGEGPALEVRQSFGLVNARLAFKDEMR